jgi:hypothetical protein
MLHVAQTKINDLSKHESSSSEQTHLHVFDWAAVTGTLLQGKHSEVADV